MNQQEQKFCEIVEHFFSYNRPLSLLWKQEKNDRLSFSTMTRGVKIDVLFHFVGSRVKASLWVGKYDQKGFFRNEITFALNKKSYRVDFKRLGFDKVASAINLIVIDREKKERQNEEVENKVNALKRYFNFEKYSTGHYIYRQFGRDQEFSSIEFEGLYPSELGITQTLKFSSKNTDLLMKVCAYAAHLLEEEQNR